MAIAISAGHYPEKPGARHNGVTEFSFTIDWASRIAQLMGEVAVLVPVGVLRDKVEYINNHKGVLAAVEIHFNAVPGGGAAGSETLYYPGSQKGRLMAQHVQHRLGAMFTPDRGAKEGYYQMNPAKGPDFFLAKTRVPSIIIEPQFMEHLSDIRSKTAAACAVIAEQLATWQQEYA